MDLRNWTTGEKLPTSGLTVLSVSIFVQLPEGVNVAKDAKVALVKAAKQFIIHATQ